MPPRNNACYELARSIYDKALELEKIAIAGEMLPPHIEVSRYSIVAEQRAILKLEIIDQTSDDQEVLSLLEFDSEGRLLDASVFAREEGAVESNARIYGRRLDGFLNMVWSSLLDES